MFQNRTVVSLDDEAIVNGRFGWEESPYTSAKCECVDVLPTKLELELSSIFRMSQSNIFPSQLPEKSRWGISVCQIMGLTFEV